MEEIIRRCYSAYEKKDRAALDCLLTQDFTFTSPVDDNISREIYFSRCWPNSEHIDHFEIKTLLTDGDEALVVYECQPSDGRARFRNTECFKMRGDKIQHVDVYFGAETAPNVAEKEIRSVLDKWAAAIRKKDVDGVANQFSADSVRFYLAPPLQAIIPLRENLQSWFASFRGEISYEMRDLHIFVSNEVAYAHSFNRIVGTRTTGEKADMWLRETFGFRKIDGRWFITHAHESVPFYMDSNPRPALDLQPPR
jgi:PhnB protein